MSNERFASVWEAIEDTLARAKNMQLRSPPMMALKDHLARGGISQRRAAKLFAVTQPRSSDRMRGKIAPCGLDALVNMAVAAGLRVEMRIAKAA